MNYHILFFSNPLCPGTCLGGVDPGVEVEAVITHHKTS